MNSEALNIITERASKGYLTPLDLTSVFLALLRENFSNRDNIITNELKNLLYSEGNDTKLIIESASLWDPLKAGIRPSILVARDQWAADPPYIASSRVLETTPDKYIRMIHGAHQILCVSRNYAETELLSNEVFLFLIQISPIIVNYFPFHVFYVTGLSRIRPLDEGRTHFVVAIPIRYSFNTVWEIKDPNKPPIKS